jgi:hypothetical protein
MGSAALIRLTASSFAASILCLISSPATAVTLQSLWGSPKKFKMAKQKLRGENSWILFSGFNLSFDQEHAGQHPGQDVPTSIMADLDQPDD